MLPFEDRFTRQRQLREVGLAGQRRIEASSVVVGNGAADVVAADYLQRSGVQIQVVRDVEFVGFTSAEMTQARAACAFEGPAHYLAGTLAALGHLRSVLGMADGSASGCSASSTAAHDTTGSAPQPAARGKATSS